MQAAVVIAAVALAATFPTFGAVPGPVPTDAVFGADGKTFIWSAATEATAYNVYRGEDVGSYDQECRVYRTSATSALLDETPSPGRLFYFLVSGVNGEGEGPLGADGAGGGIPNTRPCVDADTDLVADNLDNCPLATNPTQADQDLNGVGDRCDPATYDFEGDAVGAPPAEMVRLGPLNQALTVKDLSGDRAVSFDQTGVGAHERFERLLAGMPLQDTTVYVDVQESPDVGSIELWSEGAYGWNAGSGIIVQIDAAGIIKYYDRRGQQVPASDGPPLPTDGRLRLRLVKGAGANSTLHVDAWDGASWSEDYATFPVADDHLYRGLGAVVADHLGGRRALRRITVVHAVPAGDLILRKHFSWSADWKVFQRDGSDLATVPVRFYYRLAETGAVQARVVSSVTGAALVGHDWADHEVTLAAADGSEGAIDLPAVPAGGNYDVEVRLVRPSDGAVLAEEVIAEIAVGDVFVAGGQSNMSGYSGNLDGAEAPVDAVHVFGNDYLWKRASEPMDDGTDQVDLVSSESPLHSLMLRFGKEIAQAMGVPVGIIPGPLGGTNLYSQWQRNGARHDDRGTLYGSLLHRTLVQGYAVPVKGFLWYQGESDVGRTDYEANLTQLIAQYRDDLEAPDLVFGIVQLATNFRSNLDAWIDLQEQQRRVVASDPQSVLTATVDLPRSDTIHLDVEGYKTAGTRLATEFREHVYGEPIDASAELLGVALVGNNRKIELAYDREVSGGEPALYRVIDGDKTIPVDAVSVLGSVVTLDLGRRVQPGATVSYGYSWEPTSAWVKDTAGTAVACFKGVPVP